MIKKIRIRRKRGKTIIHKKSSTLHNKKKLHIIIK